MDFNLDFGKAEKVKQRSQFLLTINPQMTIDQISREEKIRLVSEMKRFIAILKTKPNTFCKSGYNPKTIGCDYRWEISTLKKFVHVHCILKFDRYALLSFEKIRKYLNETISVKAGNVHFDCKFIKDNMQSAILYMNKQQSLIKINENEGKDPI